MQRMKYLTAFQSYLEYCPDGWLVDAQGQRLSHRADTRSTGTIETMPDSLLTEIEDAVAAYASPDEGSASG